MHEGRDKKRGVRREECEDRDEKIGIRSEG